MALKKKIDPRSMMEKAVEVMRQSVAEQREDGKPNPLVGAVLVRPDGSTETAARGELRAGNHAEYILLERKCVSEKLDGSLLFTTLEPCLDRNEPKRGCARHIVSARIKEVYVGIEDDNPTVAGKGIKHLQRNGVTVHMFDRDLQEVILAENKEFFDWARKQVGRPSEEPIKLSKYEDPLPAVEFRDLSDEALELYHSKVNVGAAVDSEDFRRLLRQQGVLVDVDGKSVPSGFGAILFGKSPANSMPQARLLARAELADGKSSRMDFDGALVLVPGELEAWLNKVLPSTIDRSRMERREQVDLPFEMIREAVVNALIHRDYDIVEQKCQLVVDRSTIVIKSPGGPIPPITLEQMRSFSAPMKSRNPLLHYVFARLDLAEEQGFGLTSLKEHAEELGLPLPTYSMEGDSLVLTIYRSAVSATEALSDQVKEQLSASELKGFQWLAKQDTVTRRQYQIAMSIGPRAGGLQLKKFIDLGIVERIGSGKAAKYRALR